MTQVALHKTKHVDGWWMRKEMLLYDTTSGHESHTLSALANSFMMVMPVVDGDARR
jgi:hypothetical protein